nr:hypothetical protein CFP56_26489 [Quercus suber]
MRKISTSGAMHFEYNSVCLRTGGGRNEWWPTKANISLLLISIIKRFLSRRLPRMAAPINNFSFALQKPFGGISIEFWHQ